MRSIKWESSSRLATLEKGRRKAKVLWSCVEFIECWVCVVYRIYHRQNRKYIYLKESHKESVAASKGKPAAQHVAENEQPIWDILYEKG